MTNVNKNRLSLKLIVMAVSMLLLLVSTGQCDTVVSQCIEGNGDTAQRSRQVDLFDRVELHGAYTVTLKRGDTVKCTVRGDRNLLNHVLTQVENGRLLVCNTGSLRLKQPLEIDLQVPNLRSFDANGAHEVSIIDLKAQTFTLVLDGANLVKISGQVENLKISLDGSSILDATELVGRTASIDASGTTSTQLNVSQSLNVIASGISEVVYYQAPPSVVVDLSGLAEVRAQK